LYLIAVTTAIRLGELIGLKWSDINFQEGYLHISKQIQPELDASGKRVSVKTPKGDRVIELGNRALHALKVEYDRQKIAKAFAGDKWVDNDLVFPNSIGNPRNGNTIRKAFYNALKDAGVKKIRFHDLRHTAAAILLNSKIPVIKVSAILGHANVSTTLNIYGHLISDMYREAAKVMDNLLLPENRQPPRSTRKRVIVRKPRKKSYSKE